MLNKLKFKLTTVGNWHIGVVVNQQFQRYTTGNEVVVDLCNDQPSQVQLVFLGRDHNDPAQSDWYCQINSILLNELDFIELIQYNTFSSDNADYKEIFACNYINLNGVLSLTVTPDTARELLENYLNGK